MIISQPKIIFRLPLYWIFVVLLISDPAISLSQSNNQTISDCFAKSNFAQLSSYFVPGIEVSLGKEEKTLSREEAKEWINGFFAKNPIQQFNTVHEGGTANSLKYFIGSITTPNKRYRTYVLYKEENGKILISELRIEAEK